MKAIKGNNLFYLLLFLLIPLAIIFQPKAAIEEKAFIPTPSPIPSSPAISFNQSAECKITNPVQKVKVNQEYGLVDHPLIPSKKHFHYGIDFDGQTGEAVLSTTCGKVIFVGREFNKKKYNWGFGNRIEIEDKEGKVHLYAHLSKNHVKPGALVKAEQKIAEIGSTGNSTFSHLHYEIRKADIKVNKEEDLKNQTENPSTFLNLKTK